MTCLIKSKWKPNYISQYDIINMLQNTIVRCTAIIDAFIERNRCYGVALILKLYQDACVFVNVCVESIDISEKH